MNLGSKFIKLQSVRFLLSGGINTALTYALYLILIRFLSYGVSYTITYVVGIVIAFLIGRFFVFNASRGVVSALLFPLVYGVQYLTGLAVLWIWIEKLGLNVALGPAIVTLVTLPVTFALSRWIFGSPSAAKSSGQR
jgi:putative flippase GtrA